MIKTNRLTASPIVKAGRPGRNVDGCGLALQLSHGGKVAAWIFRYRRGGRERAMGLGSVAGVRLATARKAAAGARETLAQGNDPLDERHRASAGTFAQCAKEYFEQFKGTVAPKQQTRWQNAFAAYVFPTIGAMDVAAVTSEHVLRILQPLWARQTESARKLRGRIEKIFDLAIFKGLRPDNPARWRGQGGLSSALPSPRKFHRTVHHQAIAYPSLPAFMSALRERNDAASAALRFLTLTETRTGDVLAMRWCDLDDLDAPRVWTIAATKTGAAHQVPLCGATAAILLADLKTKASPSPSDRVFSISKNQILETMRDMGEEACPHGMRATFKTWASEKTHFAREVIEEALAHKIGGEVERAYWRGAMVDKRRPLMTAWAEYLSDADERKVIAIR